MLVEVARNPDARVRDLAAKAGLTERAVHGILADLEAAGYLTRERQGRRNSYTVNQESLFRHPSQEGHSIGPFLQMLTGTTRPGVDAGDDGKSQAPRRV